MKVMKTALKERSNLPGAYAEHICGILREKMQSLELAERDYNMDYINIIYVGGGALLARDYAGKYRSHATCLPSIRLAKNSYPFALAHRSQS